MDRLLIIKSRGPVGQIFLYGGYFAFVFFADGLVGFKADDNGAVNGICVCWCYGIKGGISEMHWNRYYSSVIGLVYGYRGYRSLFKSI